MGRLGSEMAKKVKRGRSVEIWMVFEDGSGTDEMRSAGGEERYAGLISHWRM
jgi:hypothetical protein